MTSIPRHAIRLSLELAAAYPAFPVADLTKSLWAKVLSDLPEEFAEEVVDRTKTTFTDRAPSEGQLREIVRMLTPAPTHRALPPGAGMSPEDFKAFWDEHPDSKFHPDRRRERIRAQEQHRDPGTPTIPTPNEDDFKPGGRLEHLTHPTTADEGSAEASKGESR